MAHPITHVRQIPLGVRVSPVDIHGLEADPQVSGHLARSPSLSDSLKHPGSRHANPGSHAINSDQAG